MGGDEQSVCNGDPNRSSVANLFIADAAHGTLGNFYQCYRSSSLSGEITRVCGKKFVGGVRSQEPVVGRLRLCCPLFLYQFMY